MEEVSSLANSTSSRDNIEETLESSSVASSVVAQGQIQLPVEEQNGFHEDTFEDNDFENFVDAFELDSAGWEHDDLTDGELSTTHINNDLVEEVRKNIITKIDEYNEKISEEESSFMAMKDLLLKKKKGQTVLMTEINKEKKEFYEKIRREKELFEKKQEYEMNTFIEHIR